MKATSVSEPAIGLFIKAVSDKKAYNIVSLDIQNLTSIADTFILCSGSSSRQVTAIAESIIFDLKKHGVMPLSREGLKEGHWIIIDYGHVIIHVFYEPVREFYNLESLWADAEKIVY